MSKDNKVKKSKKELEKTLKNKKKFNSDKKIVKK